MRKLILSAVLLCAMTLSACGGAPTTSITLPPILQSANTRVQEAYIFALSHHDSLTHIPCYCGCSPIGHESNAACYVRQLNEDGSIEIDLHAIGCGICVDITHDVMRLEGEGWSQWDIRAYIDETYAPGRPPMDTPLPPRDDA